MSARNNFITIAVTDELYAWLDAEVLKIRNTGVKTSRNDLINYIITGYQEKKENNNKKREGD
ncbi:MAG: hypothetical protein NUV98_07335 [Candidatus Roizmanbacteria bacterium]|nr:hypothetical protein [Candidatus Roizmanbacteria bacterium]